MQTSRMEQSKMHRRYSPGICPTYKPLTRSTLSPPSFSHLSIAYPRAVEGPASSPLCHPLPPCHHWRQPSPTAPSKSLSCAQPLVCARQRANSARDALAAAARSTGGGGGGGGHDAASCAPQKGDHAATAGLAQGTSYLGAVKARTSYLRACPRERAHTRSLLVLPTHPATSRCLHFSYRAPPPPPLLHTRRTTSTMRSSSCDSWWLLCWAQATARWARRGSSSSSREHSTHHKPGWVVVGRPALQARVPAHLQHV